MPYQQFNMEGLSKIHVATGRLHVQARFKKDAYFLVPLSKQSRKMIRFQWTGNLYEFLCPWHRSSSTYFREASKSLDINLKESDDNSHIARRQTSLKEGHRQLDDTLL